MTVVVLAIIILILLAISTLVSATHRKPAKIPAEQTKYTAKYEYTRKDYVMTATEAEFFRRLEHIAGERYYIFPQIHLSSLLNHRIRGQSWRGSLSHIQRKSVDYVLVDKQTMRTKYAVELDDRSHNKPERQERDGIVAQLLNSCSIPLVRFHDVQHLTNEQIIEKFKEAIDYD